MYWKKEINGQVYRIITGNEAHRRINEAPTDSVNISPSGTGRAAYTNNIRCLMRNKTNKIQLQLSNQFKLTALSTLVITNRGVFAHIN